MIQARKLRAILRIPNFISGDGIVNMLMVEAILCDKDYSVTMFCNVYKDAPSKMFKAVVLQKNRFCTNWDETKLTKPLRL